MHGLSAVAAGAAGARQNRDISRLVDQKRRRLNDVHNMKRWAGLSADVLMNDLT